MTDTRPSVMLVSVGSAIGAAVLACLEHEPALRAAVRVVGVAFQAEAPGNFRCDRVHLLSPATDADALRERLAALIAAERPRLVLPCRDDVLEPLAALAEAIDPAAGTILVSRPAAVAIANDKYATHLFARRHGLPFAETAVDRDGLDAIERAHGYPMIAKPRGGHGSLGVSIVRHRDEAEAALDAVGLCLQPYIGPPADLDALLPDLRRGPPLAYSLPGADLSAAMVALDRDGRVMAYQGWRAPVLVVGEPRRVEVDPDPAIEQAARRFAAALAGEGLFGPCAFQFRRDADGRPVCFEVNARFGGVEMARTLLGAPLVAHLVRHFVFGPLPPMRSAPVEGRIIQRALTDRLVERHDVAPLAAAGVWSAAASRPPRS